MKLSPAESRQCLPQITQIYAESIAQLCLNLQDPTSLRLRRTTDASGQAGLLETNFEFLLRKSARSAGNKFEFLLRKSARSAGNQTVISGKP